MLSEAEPLEVRGLRVEGALGKVKAEVKVG